MIPARRLVSSSLVVALAGLSLRLAACSVEVPPDPPPATDQGCLLPASDGGPDAAPGAAPDAGTTAPAPCAPAPLP